MIYNDWRLICVHTVEHAAVPQCNFLVGHRVWLQQHQTASCSELNSESTEVQWQETVLERLRLTFQEILPVLRFLHWHRLVHGSFIAYKRKRGHLQIVSESLCCTDLILVAGLHGTTQLYNKRFKHTGNSDTATVILSREGDLKHLHLCS